MASGRERFQEDVRLRVLRLLNTNSHVSTRQIANKVGISNGSAHYVLTALIEKGFVKLENFRNSSQKRKYIYLLTRKGFKEKSILTKRFIHRKRKEFYELKAEIEMLEKEEGISYPSSNSQV